MAPSVTQPPPPSLAAGHTHTRSFGKGPRRAKSSKFAFPHPTAFPGRPQGPAGAKELIPRARSPLRARPPARPPFPSEPASCALARAGVGEPASGTPQVATITCKSSGGEGARRGFCLQLPGSGSSAPGGFSSSCPCFPLPPSSNLTFRNGGGGGRGSQPAQRGPSEGVCSRQRPAARSGAAGGVRAGERSPRSQVTHGSGEKPWREKGAGAQRWSHYRRPRPRLRTALKPAMRRGWLLGSTRPRAAPLGSAAAVHQGRGGERRGGRGGGWGGKGAARGTGVASSRPPVARGVADVRPTSGASPPVPQLRPWVFPRRAWRQVSSPRLEVGRAGCGETLRSVLGAL